MQVAEEPPEVQVMVHMPAPTLVTTPEEDTVATPVLLELQE